MSQAALTERMKSELHRLSIAQGSKAYIEVFGLSSTQRALRTRGLLMIQFIGMRFYRVALTPAGRQAAARVAESI